MDRKWIERQYNFKDHADVAHKYVKTYCKTNQFIEFIFCGPHSKYHGARGMIKHYHFSFVPKLGNGVCGICRIACACVACKPMLDKPWISGIP